MVSHNPTDGGELITIDALTSDVNQTKSSSVISVVPIQGAVTRHGYVSFFGSAPGMQQIGEVLKRLDANKRVKAIVLDVDSPGGTVCGTFELTRLIRGIRDAGRTRIETVVDALMASAAASIGTATSRVTALHSSTNGSIGVINGYAEYSKALANAGISVEMRRVPALKAKNDGLGPMDDQQRAQMDEGLHRWYKVFVNEMAANRSISPEQVIARFGGGLTMDADKAKDAGMIDELGEIGDVLGRLRDDARRSSRMNASISRLNALG